MTTPNDADTGANAIETALLRFVSDELISDRDALDLQADDDLLGSGLVDSLGVMRLIRFIEAEWQVTVPPADVTLEHFMTVRDVTAYLATLRAGADAADG
ncbi:MAG: acyl carrier protein [Acidobacteriota bacterium]